MKHSIWQEHITEDDLEAYAMRRLDASAASMVEEHLLLCTACQTELEKFEDFLRAFRTASPAVRQQAARRRGVSGGWFQLVRATFRAPWAAPAMAMAALAVVAVIPRDSRTAPVEVVRLESARGDSGIADAAAGARLHLVLDARGLPELPVYRIDVVDASGSPVWSGDAKPAPSGLAVTTERALGEGTYWVRISGRGELLREFGIRAAPRK